MSTSSFLRERAQAYADNIVAAILFVGGAVMAGWLVNHFALVWGLSPKAAIVAAWAIALLVAVSLSLLLKPKQKRQEEKSGPVNSPQQNLTQSGIVNAPHNENKSHNEFNPTLNVYVPVSQEQPQKQSQKQTQNHESKPPSLESVEIGNRIVKKSINPYGELHEKSDLNFPREELLEAEVAFAEFYRGVDGSTEPWVDVRAHIHFFDANEKLLFRTRDAHWHKAEGKHQSFNVGDSDDLIIAIVGEGKMLPYAGHYEDVHRIGLTVIKEFEKEGEIIEGKNFHVRVELIGTRGNIVTLNQTFDYDLTTNPNADFRLRKGVEINKAFARELLLPLLQEGHQIEREMSGIPLSHISRGGFYGRFTTWSEQVERTLLLYLGESFAARFRGEEQDNWARDLNGKIIKLEKILRWLAD